MNSNRALWQAAKLEMKGKLIVLDLMEVRECVSRCTCVHLGVGWGVGGGGGAGAGVRAGARVAGTGQMRYTAESHARLPLCLGLSF